MRKKLIAGGSLVFVAIIVFNNIVYSDNLKLTGLAIDAELQKLKQARIPATIDELVPANLPDGENAALIYKEIFKIRESLYATYKEECEMISNYGIKGSPWDKATEEMKKKAVNLILNDPEFSDLFQKIEKVVNMKCQFFNKKDYQDSRGLMDTMFSNFSQMRSCATLLASKAQIEAENREGEKASHTALIGLKLAKSLANEPMLFSQMVRMAIDTNVCLYGIERNLQKRKGNVVLYQSLIDEIEGERKNNIIAYGLKGEMVIFGMPHFNDQKKYIDKVPEGFYDQLSESEKGEIKKVYKEPEKLKDPKKFWDRQYLVYLQTMSEMISLAEKPYWEIREPLERLVDGIQKLTKEDAIETQLLTPSFSNAFLREARLDATLGNAEIALALRIYKEEIGNYPDKLERLVPKFLKELPKDPFTGKDHIYKRAGDGFTVYSLGDNAKDDEGITGNERQWKGDFDIVWKCEE